jgi:hypothetical protein
MWPSGCGHHILPYGENRAAAIVYQQKLTSHRGEASTPKALSHKALCMTHFRFRRGFDFDAPHAIS